MTTKKVAFSEVKLGDRVYHLDYYAPDKWRKVTKIKHGNGYISLGLGTSARKSIDTRIYIVGYAESGIMIQEDK